MLCQLMWAWLGILAEYRCNADVAAVFDLIVVMATAATAPPTGLYDVANPLSAP